MGALSFPGARGRGSHQVGEVFTRQPRDKQPSWVVKRKAVASSRHPIDPQTVRSISWLGLVASPRLARRGPAHSKALCTLSLVSDSGLVRVNTVLTQSRPRGYGMRGGEGGGEGRGSGCVWQWRGVKPSALRASDTQQTSGRNHSAQPLTQVARHMACAGRSLSCPGWPLRWRCSRGARTRRARARGGPLPLPAASARARCPTRGRWA